MPPTGVVVKLVALALIWAYLQHLCAGLRHLWSDVSHAAVSKEFGALSAQAVLVGSYVNEIVARVVNEAFDDLDAPVVIARAAQDLRRRPDGKLHLDRVALELVDGRYLASSVGAQASNQLAATAMAHGLALLPDGDGISGKAQVSTDPVTQICLSSSFHRSAKAAWGFSRRCRDLRLS